MAFGWTAATWLAVGAGVTGVATLAGVDPNSPKLGRSTLLGGG